MKPNAQPAKVIEIFGEGVTDIGKSGNTPSPADHGVVPVVVKKLCDYPPDLLVKRKALQFLVGKGVWQKVRFAKQQSRYNNSIGCVFVLDTDGKQAAVLADLTRGRDSHLPGYPMAIGVAHQCIEAWLLSDPSAIKQGLGLSQKPMVPSTPEIVGATTKKPQDSAKATLSACHSNKRHPNSAEKTAIAELMTLATAEAVCPSFAAFAEEVRRHIRPLFPPPPPATGAITPDAGEQPDAPAE